MKSGSTRFNDLTEHKISGVTVHEGRSFSFKSDLVRLPDGREAKKDYVFYPEAVGIVPFINKSDIILVRQFRYPVGRVIYEIPAGKLDSPSEDLKSAAERELLEEAGYRAGKLELFCSYFPCAGYSTERLHLFRARDLAAGSTDPDDDEFIACEKVPFEKAVAMIDEGKIEDSKTIIALLYLKVHGLKF
jgi:ADP-ribose pyrophosphatase